MGKTNNDKEYEKGVHDGQEGGLARDIIHSFIDSGSIYDKGYNYGEKHRDEARCNKAEASFDTEPPYCLSCGQEIQGDETYCADCEACAEQEAEEEEEAERQRKAAIPLTEEQVLEKKEEEERRFLEQKKREKEEELKKLLKNKPFHVSSQKDKEKLEEMVKTGEIFTYSGVSYAPPDYLVTYRCNFCEREWEERIYNIRSECFISEIVDCRCEIWQKDNFVKALLKILIYSITGTNSHGRARLVRKKEIEKF